MHYACLVFTNEFPTDSVLEKVLAPFNKDLFFSKPESEREYLPIMWDWWQVGGRYNGRLKLNVNETEEKYKWRFFAREPRAGRLFRSYLLEKANGFAKKAKDYLAFVEEYFLQSMGLLDGFVYVDGCAVSDILNIESIGCYSCIDSNGNAFSQSTWNGKEYQDDKDFELKLKNVIQNSAECYVCVVDLHD